MTAIPPITSAIPTTTSASSPGPPVAAGVRGRRRRRFGTIRLIGATGVAALAMVAAACGSDTTTTATTPGAAATQPPVAAANAAEAQPAAANYIFTVNVKIDAPAGWIVDYSRADKNECLEPAPAISKTVAKRNDYFSIVMEVRNEGDCLWKWSSGWFHISLRDPETSKGNSPYGADFRIWQYGPGVFKVHCDYRDNVRCDGDTGIGSATAWIKPNGV
jgi:hypothetical protein